MPDSLGLYVLIVVALGIGFLLGRREKRGAKRRAAPAARSQPMGGDYFQGLNHLLNDRPDLAIESFMDSLQVEDRTVDTHLALGTLVRRRGEVDKAIRIHQNVLARPVLSTENRTQAELELARDYLAAGLLDRAENILLELAKKRGKVKTAALTHLQDIYQREREWQQAIDAGRQLVAARGNDEVRTALAHYQCELATEALSRGDLADARDRLGKAEQHDPSCPRTPLVLADVESEAGRYRETLRQLRKVVAREPALVGETLERFREAAIELGNEKAYPAYLEECLAGAPSIAVISELAKRIERAEGEIKAQAFLAEQLTRSPSLAGFHRLLQAYEGDDAGMPEQHVKIAREFAGELCEREPTFRCENCGFAGRMLLWQCPSCRDWGSIRPL